MDFIVFQFAWAHVGTILKDSPKIGTIWVLNMALMLSKNRFLDFAWA